VAVFHPPRVPHWVQESPAEAIIRGQLAKLDDT
jgi:hypothetical protein